MAAWLKLHRKAIDSRVFSDAQLWRLWCWCLIKSNWKRGWYLGCELLPGQFATGREAASDELGVSGSAWYRGMQKLQEFGCIRLEVNNRFTKVSIVNWEKYQGEVNNERTTDEQPPDSQRTTDEHPADTIEEEQEFKEGKKDRNTLSPGEREFLNDPRFARAWDEWGRHLLGVGKTMSTASGKAQLYRIVSAGWDLEDAINLVRYSTAQGAKNLIINGDHRGSSDSSNRKRGGRKRSRADDEDSSDLEVMLEQAKRERGIES